MKTALDSARADLTKKHAEELDELQRRFAILEMLPEGEVPLVCNYHSGDALNPTAWVSYHSPAYDPENKWNPVALLEAMEAKGWTMLPEAALVKWDNYRRAIEPCSVADAQAFPHRSGYRYSDGDTVAPYWVNPEQHTKPEFSAFMRAPNGKVYLMKLDVPSIGARISARVHEGAFGREWSFVPGSARLFTPPHWSLHQHSRAYVDTEQGISGAVYFLADSSEKTASAALRFLLTPANS